MITKKFKLKTALQNRAGISVFMVLVFMIVAGLLGTAMMFMSRRGAEMQGDFYQMRIAEEAAESAVNWFKALVLDHGNDAEIITWMENFNNAQPVWFSGGSGNWSSMFSATDVQNAAVINFSQRQPGVRSVSTSAQLQVVDVDNENSLVTIRAVARGEAGSQKTLNAVYRLSGRQNFITTSSSIANERVGVIEIHGEGNYIINVAANVEGSVYSRGNLHINGGVTINGDVRVMGNFTMDANAVVTGNIYVGGNATFRTGQLGVGPNANYVWVNGNTQIDGDVTIGADVYFADGISPFNGSIIAEEDVYIDDRIANIDRISRIGGNLTLNTTSIGSFNSHFNMVNNGEVRLRQSHNPDRFRHNGVNSTRVRQNQGDMQVNRATVVPVEDSSPITDATKVTVDVNYVRDHMVNLQLSDHFNQSLLSFDANAINQLYRTGSATINGRAVTVDLNEIRENNGFLVIRVDRGINDAAWQGTLAAGVKVKLIIDHGQVHSNGNFWGSTVAQTNPDNNNSSTLGVLEGTGRITNWGYHRSTTRAFRGVYYNGRNEGGQTTYETLANFHGSFLFNSQAQFNINSGGFSGRYDPQAVGAFAHVLRRGGNPIVPPPVNERRQVASIYPFLLTKY